ncbi:MAG TPA: tetratricopeptide repeat protein [Polyangiaceae bacterium]|nr:tetratricopeptide repeat protein [Polyangiaceae bacterium]
MRNALATGLVIITLSASAAAEYPPCDKTPSNSDVEAAKGMHKAAEQYYARARYDKAIDSWQEAYGFDCTAHRLLINIGNAHEKLGNTAEAIEAFETYIERMGSSADPTIIEKVKNLRDLMSTQPDPNPNPDPVPPPPPPRPVPTNGDGGPGIAPWVVVGAGGAVAVVGAIVMGIGIQKESAAAEECPERGDGAVCPQEVADDGNLGIRMQIGGGVTLGIGLAAAAGGLLWWALTMPSSDGASEGDAVAASLELGPVTVTPELGLTPSYQGLGLSGRF